MQPLRGQEFRRRMGALNSLSHTSQSNTLRAYQAGWRVALGAKTTATEQLGLAKVPAAAMLFMVTGEVLLPVAKTLTVTVCGELAVPTV